MTIEDRARKYFHVELPVLSSVLKSAFRAAAKQLHTDTGGDKNAFISMKETYDKIQEMGLVVQTDADLPAASWKVLCTVGGTPLSDLGLGLGPTVNGRDCETCLGKGYTAFTQRQRVTCPRCFGGGDGWGSHPFCAVCRGRGTVEVGPAVTRYHQCGVCEGTGEIKIYNPVILKGAMSQAQRKGRK